MTEILVTRMGYHVSRGEPIVDIHGRTEDGERKHYKLKGAESYFYTKDKPKDNSLIKRIEHEGKDLYNNRLWKIVTKTPSDIYKLKDNYRYHYEADVPYIDKVRANYKIKSQIEISDENNSMFIKPEQIKPVNRTINAETVYFDIETMDDGGGFPKPEIAFQPVVSIAIYSTQLDKYFIIIIGEVDKEKIKTQFKEMGCDKEVIIKMVKDEKKLFYKFNQIISHINPDVITGWNVDDFDVLYLETRSKNNAYACPNFRKYAVFDLMKGYKKLHKGKTFLKLELVSQKELGVGKLPREKIHIMFKENKEKLCVYNLWDVELTRKIDIVKNIVNFHLNLSWFAGCELYKTIYQEPLVDKYLLHEINGVVNVPSKDMLEKTTGKFKGAYVDKPVSGKFTNVGMIDFASMYPRIILSCNLSVETKVNKSYIKEDGTKGFKEVIKVDGREIFNMPSGINYLKEPEGLIPHIVKNLIEMRDNIKKDMRKEEKGSVEYKALWEQQRAVKYFTNAVYGVLGSNIFRLADRDVASDITNTGRILIKYTMEEVEKMGFKPLYADTDSVFFETGKETIEEAVEVGLIVEKRMNELYIELAKTWNGEKETINEMKLEKVYQSWIQSGAKKRHIGAVGWDVDTDEKFITHLPIKKRLDIKGLDIVRSNVPEITKEAQEFILITALENKDYYDTVTKYIVNLKKDFFNKKIDTKMLIPASWGKDDYDKPPAFYRAMRYSIDNGFLEMQLGDAYSWIYVNSIEDKPKTDVFAVELEPEEISDEININYEKMWKRCIVKPLDAIFEGLNIPQHILTKPVNQKTILDF